MATLFLLFLLCLLVYGTLFALLFQILVHLFDLHARKSGAFYCPSKREKIQQMIEFAQPIPGQRVVDLGSGDGRLVVAFAKIGANIIGYEINPLLVLISRFKLNSLRLTNKAKIVNRNYWSVPLDDVEIVVLFGIDWMMEHLEKKLRAELKPGAKVISNMFAFPTWKPQKNTDGIYLYEKL